MNKNKYKKAMNGLTDIKDICYLQIKGKNKLAKEINETRHLAAKHIDLDALHRNELTQEIEGVNTPTKNPPNINYQQYTMEETIAKQMTLD